MRTGTIGIVAGLAGLLGAAEPRGVVVEVAAGPHARRDTPVVLAVPEPLQKARAFTLEGLDDHRPEAIQRLPGDPARVVWIVRAPLEAGATRRYRLAAAGPTAPVAGVTCRDDGTGLEIKVGGRPALRYHHAVAEPPAGIEPIYRRSGFIHPLSTPSGLAVTDDFPPDHAHQHGVFFAWVNTTFNGHKVDFWNQKTATGRVGHEAILGTASGPVFGGFSARLRHDDITDPAHPAPVLDEVWTVRAYATSGAFLIDFESEQSCAGERPLAINEYHYGGMGLRGNRAWYDPEVKGGDPSRGGSGDFLTSEGKRRADGNHTRPRWVDLSGTVGDRAGGVAILDSPANFRSPQPVRLHPDKPYFCFAPMVLGEFAIAPGRPYVSRYRLVVHDGLPDSAAIERAWRDYAEPPVVRVVAE